MSQMWTRFVYCTLVLAAVGCGGGSDGKVTVNGQLLKSNKPLTLKNDVMKNMVFFPFDALKANKPFTTYPGTIHEDGSFEVRDIPPGKYLITLQLLGDTGDMCKGAFADEKRSKLIREVDGKEPLKIDVTKPAG